MNILLVLPGFIIVFVVVIYYERKIRNLSVKPKNKVHFYVAREKNGMIFLYLGKPERQAVCFTNSWIYSFMATKSCFKYFGLNPDDFNGLKWEDEPVEVFVNMKE